MRRTGISRSATSSLGVNVCPKAAALRGDDCDVEITEAHHRFKKNAPSGTPLALGRSVANALGRGFGKIGINRKGMLSERGKKELALLSDRAGDIVGERLEFIHRVHRRDTFSCGALCAAGRDWQRKPAFIAFRICWGKIVVG